MTEQQKGDNLRFWDRHAIIDPTMTKPISGKQYSGTSPNAHHIIWCLTDMFGPVGVGFGWDVEDQGFEKFEDGTVIHWCLIRFWHGDKNQSFHQYGQTKMYYMTKAGKPNVDEDAPKKSLTDAITKAASQVGVAADIFLGRWDDNKYMDDVREAFRPKTTREKIDEAVTVDDINNLMTEAAEVGTDAKKHLMAKAGELGLTFNAELKKFTEGAAQ